MPINQGFAWAPTADSAPSYAEIQELIQTGRTEQAIAALNRFLLVAPANAQAHCELGVLYYRKGEKAGARRHYEEAVRLEPKSPDFKKILADFYHVELGLVEEALRLYVNILSADPNDVDTLMTAGHLCVSQHRFQDAARFYRHALEVDPEHGEAGRFLDAVQRRLEQTSATDPVSKPVGGAEIQPVARKNCVQQRLTDYCRLATDLVTDADRLDAMATDMVKLGKWAEAAVLLRQVVRLVPYRVEAYDRLGNALRHSGDDDSARAAYTEALRLRQEVIEGYFGQRPIEA